MEVLEQLILPSGLTGRQLPLLIEERQFDTRLLSDRKAERLYRRYRFAYMKLEAVDDVRSYHASLSNAEKQKLFDERLPILHLLEDAYLAQEARCVINAARRKASNGAYRYKETNQRCLFVDAWPEAFRYIGNRLPYRPYVSDNPKLEGSQRRALHAALSWRYVQYNPSAYTHLLIVDYDARSGIDVAEVWKHAGLARPTYIVRTPGLPKGHLVWAIKVPIPTLDMAKSKSLSYYRAIEVAYTKAVDGDFGFTGLLTKNPVHPFGFEVDWLNPHPYTLKDLASFVELPKNARREKREARALALSEHEKVGLGRNCAMFYTVAGWAYKAIRQYWDTDSIRWAAAVREECDLLNQRFSPPLPETEVRRISRSISSWTWANTTRADFSEIQSYRGAEGGRRSGVTRLAKAQVHAEEARALKEAGMSVNDIAKKFDVHRNTVTNLLKRNAA